MLLKVVVVRGNGVAVRGNEAPKDITKNGLENHKISRQKNLHSYCHATPVLAVSVKLDCRVNSRCELITGI